MRLIDVTNIFNESAENYILSSQKYIIQPSDEYVLHFFYQGDGIIRIGKEQFPIRSAVKFITFPGEGYAINIFPHSKAVTYYKITFSLPEDDDSIVQFINKNLRTTRIFSLNKKNRANLDDIRYKFDMGSVNSLKSAEHQILSILYSLPEKNNKETITRDTFEYIDRACEIMKKNLYTQINLTTICSELNITESHFIRLFKSYMGISPMKYYTQLRIHEAARLLTETDSVIAKIAEDLNFSNESHFNRTFKQYRTMTPGQYRNNYIKNLEARQKKSERKLQDAYTLLQKIIDATPDLIFFKDTNGVLMGCNEAFSEIVGLPKEKIIGFSDFEIHPEEMAQFFTEKDQKIFQNNLPYKNEEWMTYPNGVKKQFEVYKAPFHDSKGDIIGLLGISRDITEREKIKLEMKKSAQDEQTANEQKTQFLLTMANEYLTSISRIQQSLMKDPNSRIVPGDNHLSLNMLLFECDYVSVLTRDIIDFIKYQSGEAEIQIKGFNLIKFLNRLKHSLQKNHKFNSLINIRIHSEIPQIVFGDELRLHHLLVHLINTALRNSQGTKVDLTCEYKKNTATFQIEIQSVNFSKSKQESMLRSVNSKADHSFFKKGVDLSLLIANRISKAMGGELFIDFKDPEILLYDLNLPLPSDVESLDLYYLPKNENRKTS